MVLGMLFPTYYIYHRFMASAHVPVQYNIYSYTVPHYSVHAQLQFSTKLLGETTLYSTPVSCRFDPHHPNCHLIFTNQHVFLKEI